jgi:hypothetical protein
VNESNWSRTTKRHPSNRERRMRECHMSWKRMCMTLMPLALTVSACSSNPVSGEGVCAQPLTKTSLTQVSPGQAVAVFAADMWEGCNDQGCNLRLPPVKSQPVTMTLDGEAVEVGRVSVDPNTGVAQTTVTIPVSAAAGKIGLTIGFAQRADVTITVK